MPSYIVGLGSNLGNRRENLNQAVRLIASRLGTVVSQSSWIETLPLNPPDSPDLEQPNYLNGAITVYSEREPAPFLGGLLEIEAELGRRRRKGERWRPRIIDLDILAAGESIINEPRLKIPHPELENREFVLLPLKEVAPGWCHPLLLKSAEEMLSDLARKRSVTAHESATLMVFPSSVRRSGAPSSG